MKKVFLLLLSLPILSCSNMSTKLEKLWNNVVESPDREVECENVRKLTKYMSGKAISFDMIVTDSDAKEHKLPYDFPIANISVKKVHLSVYDGDKKVFESDSKWEPKDKENMNVFFHE